MMHWRVHAGLLPGRESELAALLESAGDSLQLVSGHWKQLPLPVRRKSWEIAGLALTTLQESDTTVASWTYTTGNKAASVPAARRPTNSLTPQG